MCRPRGATAGASRSAARSITFASGPRTPGLTSPAWPTSRQTGSVRGRVPEHGNVEDNLADCANLFSSGPRCTRTVAGYTAFANPAGTRKSRSATSVAPGPRLPSAYSIWRNQQKLFFGHERSPQAAVCSRVAATLGPLNPEATPVCDQSDNPVLKRRPPACCTFLRSVGRLMGHRAIECVPVKGRLMGDGRPPIKVIPTAIGRLMMAGVETS